MAKLSIVIPALNEARAIGSTLDHARRLNHAAEIIVVDGGSTDETSAIARQRGVHVLTSEAGRGAQMHVGAREAGGAAILFLHADTLVPPGLDNEILRVLEDARVVGGNCRVRFDGDSIAARFLTWLYPQLRRLGLLYGDSGIFVRRDVYEAIGGFAPLPLFEDLELVQRLRRRGRVVTLPFTVTTSSRRFERRSFAFVFARWTVLQILFWCGVPPRLLARRYADVRKNQ